MGREPDAPPPPTTLSTGAALRELLGRQPLAAIVLPQGACRQTLERLGIPPADLHAIGLDDACGNRVRFAGFEAWIALAGEDVLVTAGDATADAIAVVHVEAIRTADDAGAWGLPSTVAASDLARHLIALGPRVLPRLRPLLDDHRTAPYAGSEVAAIARRRKVRISDLAAGLMAAIAGEPYQDGLSPGERDPQLAELRRRDY